MADEHNAIDEANPLGKSPEEIDRSNRWFRMAVALGKQDEYVEMLATERRLAVAAARTQGSRNSQLACEKCGCYGGNGWLPRMDDTRYACPDCEVVR